MTIYAIGDAVSGQCFARYEATDERHALAEFSRSRLAVAGDGELSVWHLSREGVVRWVGGPGGAEMLVDDADVPRAVAKALDLDMP